MSTHAARRIAVIAGSRREYDDWCRQQEISPRTGGAFYATPMSLRGYSDVEVARTGTWRERRDLAEIERALLIVNRP